MTKNNSKEPTWQDIEKTFRQSEAARNLYADEFYEILQFFKPYFQEKMHDLSISELETVDNNPKE